MTTFKASLFLVLATWGLLVVTSAEVLNLLRREQIKRLAGHVMTCGAIPGLSLSVVKRDEIWTLPLGLANMTSREPVREDTKFAIGSLTKGFTSTLLLMLLHDSEQGYTVDSTLKDILKMDKLFADPQRSQHATVKDILSHRMGLARADLAIFGGYPRNHTLADLASSISCLPALKHFRDGFVYSNFMYSLAGHVIEKLTNQTYSDVIKSRLLGPLHMTSTVTSFNVSDPYHGMAQPYVSVGGRLKPAHHSVFKQEPFLPAFGLASTSTDMAKWLQLQLSRGLSATGVRVVQQEIIDKTRTPTTPNIINNLRPRYPQPDLTFAYGLGWHQAVYKGYRRIWHAGTLFGYTSLVWIFPDLDFAIFAATNGPAREPDTKHRLTALFFYVTDLLLGQQPWIGQSNACSFPYPSMQAKNAFQTEEKGLKDIQTTAMTSSKCGVEKLMSLEKYSGVYFNLLFGNTTVFIATTLRRSSKYLDPCEAQRPEELFIQFGQRFSGRLHRNNMSSQAFEMEPIGIFEFSAHPYENKLSTMPVVFSNFDDNGVPYTLTAVWQNNELIEFGRGWSKTCVADRPLNNGAEYRPRDILYLSLLLLSVTVPLELLNST